MLRFSHRSVCGWDDQHQNLQQYGRVRAVDADEDEEDTSLLCDDEDEEPPTSSTMKPLSISSPSSTFSSPRVPYLSTLTLLYLAHFHAFLFALRHTLLPHYFVPTSLLLTLGYFCYPLLPTALSEVRPTLMAPFVPLTFKDGLVGDVLTSLIIPILDALYTLTNLYFSSHTTATSSTAVGEAWRRVSTGAMVAPMLWRFNQNLRGCKEQGGRWPSLGNAGKYTIAAATALVGLKNGKGIIWAVCACAATGYQLMWDFQCDWRLPSR